MAKLMKETVKNAQFYVGGGSHVLCANCIYWDYVKGLADRYTDDRGESRMICTYTDESCNMCGTEGAEMIVEVIS